MKHRILIEADWWAATDPYAMLVFLRDRDGSRKLRRFVAIELESGAYFLGDTFDEAVKSARRKYPTRLSHIIWIGHRAAFHIGGLER